MEETGLKDLFEAWHVGEDELTNLLVYRLNFGGRVCCRHADSRSWFAQAVAAVQPEGVWARMLASRP